MDNNGTSSKKIHKSDVYFLKDTETDEWLISGFDNIDYPIIIIGANNSTQFLDTPRIVRIVLLHYRYLKVALNALFRSKKPDIIICFLDVMAFYLYILSRIFGKKRNIIAVNIMFNDNKSLITRIKRILFRVMLKNRHVFPTITSASLKLYYQSIFNLPLKEFFLVHDCYGKYIELKKDFKIGNGYVFCGGSNSRDWNTLINTAKLLPKIKFVIVGPSKNILGENIPENIDYYYNIGYSKFNSLMENSSLIVLPLITQSPAGLIVLLSAGLMTKAVITTDNATMREYITNKENGILVNIGDPVSFANQIESLIYDIDRLKEFGEKLHQKIEELSSPEAFANKLIKIVNKIQSNENSSN